MIDKIKSLAVNCASNNGNVINGLHLAKHYLENNELDGVKAELDIIEKDYKELCDKLYNTYLAFEMLERYARILESQH